MKIILLWSHTPPLMLKKSLFLRSSTTVRSLAAAFYNDADDEDDHDEDEDDYDDEYCHTKNNTSWCKTMRTCDKELPIKKIIIVTVVMIIWMIINVMIKINMMIIIVMIMINMMIIIVMMIMVMIT